MGRKYKGKGYGSKQSPAARSVYRGSKLISNPNRMSGATYSYSMSMASEYGSRIKAIDAAGPARKIALRKILGKGI